MMSNKCCCCCNSRFNQRNNTMAESFQHVIDFPRQTRACTSSSGREARRSWYYHPIYRQYWEQYDILQRSFEKLINPFRQHEPHHQVLNYSVTQRVRSSNQHTHHKNAHQPEKARLETRCKDASMISRKSNDRNRNTSEVSHGDQEEEEDNDVEIDADFLAFKIASEEFKRERDRKKEVTPDIKEKEEEEDESREEEQERLKELYGESAPIIAAMMQANEISFKRYQEVENYKYWPNMPLNT